MGDDNNDIRINLNQAFKSAGNLSFENEGIITIKSEDVTIKSEPLDSYEEYNSLSIETEVIIKDEICDYNNEDHFTTEAKALDYDDCRNNEIDSTVFELQNFNSEANNPLELHSNTLRKSQHFKTDNELLCIEKLIDVKTVDYNLNSGYEQNCDSVILVEKKELNNIKQQLYKNLVLIKKLTNEGKNIKEENKYLKEKLLIEKTLKSGLNYKNIAHNAKLLKTSARVLTAKYIEDGYKQSLQIKHLQKQLRLKKKQFKEFCKQSHYLNAVVQSLEGKVKELVSSNATSNNIRTKNNYLKSKIRQAELVYRKFRENLTMKNRELEVQSAKLKSDIQAAECALLKEKNTNTFLLKELNCCKRIYKIYKEKYDQSLKQSDSYNKRISILEQKYKNVTVKYFTLENQHKSLMKKFEEIPKECPYC